MSELKIEGKLHKIFDTQEVSSSFRKREFVIETEEQYPQLIKFELTQTKCDDIATYHVGDSMAVHFNVRGREWTNKNNEVVYFTTLNAWRLEKAGGSQPATQNSKAPFPTNDTEVPNDSFADDLPF